MKKCISIVGAKKTGSKSRKAPKPKEPTVEEHLEELRQEAIMSLNGIFYDIHEGRLEKGQTAEEAFDEAECYEGELADLIEAAKDVIREAA